MSKPTTNNLIISGPTASGKTSFSLKLAEQLSGEIISADSAQVYRGFDIGSDKASVTERNQIKHHCIDLLEGDQPASTFFWLKQAEYSIKNIKEKDNLPIIVGGTTLYISSFVSGLDALPPANQLLRQKLDLLSNDSLYQKALDCGALNNREININDRTRLIRAIEINQSEQTGKGAPAHKNSLILVLLRSRDELYKRIDNRVTLMLELGLLSEAKNLLKQYGPEASGFRCLGYAQCLAFLHGQLSEQALPIEIAKASRHYAKRQMTFWRNEPLKQGWKQEPPQKDTQQKSLKNKVKDFDLISLDSKKLIERIREAILTPFDRPQVWYIDANYLNEFN